MRFFCRNLNIQPSAIPFLRAGHLCLLMGALVFAFTACGHQGVTPPPTASDVSRSDVSEETLRTLVVSLNKRYEDVDGRIARNRERIEILEAELASLHGTVGVLSPADRPQTVENTKSRQMDVGSTKASTMMAPPSRPDAKELYDSALNAYYQRDFSASISRFQEFIDVYPSSDLADNALYWIGESYYANEDFEKAISHFLKVVDRYPNGGKVPDALFKTGLSYGRLKNFEKAAEFLTRVMDNYPFSTAAEKAKTALEQL